MAIDARHIIAYLNYEGHVVEIADPDRLLALVNDTDADLPLSGPHYGWDLEPLRTRTIPRPPERATTLAVAPGTPDEAGGNVSQASGTPLIKLDVGYWGGYDRGREATRDNRQRDFGVIEGHDVWLCQFRGAGWCDNGEDAPPADSQLGQLLEFLREREIGIRLVRHATAVPLDYNDGLARDRLTVILPDLHLPEKWPDRPPDEAFAGMSGTVARTLVNLLVNVQHASTDPADEDTGRVVQEYVESLHAGGTEPFPLRYVSDTRTYGSGEDIVTEPIFSTIDITPAQFQAARDLVDREIALESCWFYPRGHGARADGNATPALDLVLFLQALLEFKEGGQAVRVYQVGDLFELWMNREFLYRDYSVQNPSAVGATGQAGLQAMRTFFDEFQPRMDADWADAAGRRHPVKRYVFHRWDPAEMERRHGVGHVGTPGATTLARLRARLAERVEGVRAFSLALPSGHGGLDALPAGVRDRLDAHRRTNARGGREYLWNRIILDLLAELEFVNIYGNHDGYRGDPTLNTGLSDADKARPWISEPGLWVEHSHRWDDYNRDGMAYGAGVTNLVYYYRGLLTMDEVRGCVMPAQEHTGFMPGAAEWFRLRNFGPFPDLEQSPEPDATPVHRFGIYVGGHTHTADLVQIVFADQLRVRARRAAEEARDETVRRARELEAAAEREAAAARDAVVDTAARAERAIRDAPAWVESWVLETLRSGHLR